MNCSRTIEDRWNKGKFVKEYEECDDHQTMENWDKNLELGMEKIFEVRKLYSTSVKIAFFFCDGPWHALSSHLAKSAVSGHVQYNIKRSTRTVKRALEM